MRKKPETFAQKAKYVLVHPLVIIPIIVILIFLGWNWYLSESRDLNMPTGTNILKNSDFSEIQSNGVPNDWSVNKAGNFNLTLSNSKGYVSGKSLSFNVDSYKDGSAELLSPTVNLHANTKYLFKGFYKSTSPFNLLARYNYADGTSQLQLIRNYPSSKNRWTTVSDAFDSSGQVRSVQIVYGVGSNGNVTLNGLYLEANSGIYIDPPAKSGGNLINNADFSSVTNGMPDHWNAYQNGNNQMQAAFNSSSSSPYLGLSDTNYASGEADWQPDPISVNSYQTFNYTFTYMSSAKADVVAQYELSNGQYVFYTLATLNPSNEWTTTTLQFESPNGATMLVPSVQLLSNGRLGTKDYHLSDITIPNKTSWQQPLISITYDGGWQNQYSEALPVMNTYGYKATYYVTPAAIDTKLNMNISELTNLKNAGNELASQGYDNVDLTTLNTKRVQSEITDSKNYLNNTFAQNTTDFAAPFGATDAQVLGPLQKYYDSNRSTGNGVNTLQTFDPYNLKVFYVYKNTPLSSLQTVIDQTKEFNGWLIIVYDQVTNTTPKNYNLNQYITPAVLNQQLQLVKQSGIKVETINQALSDVEKQQ